jgi:two-component system, OmpR family, sensor histidine kinase KdpD
MAEIKLEKTQEPAKLRIYIGAAPGVGKTWDMLNDAHNMKHQRDVDVVIGLVEPHGRKETAARIRDLEIIPQKEIPYRGVKLKEMDVDAIIARHPHTVVVDELAHTNVPGSKNRKRAGTIVRALPHELRPASLAVTLAHLIQINAAVGGIRTLPIRTTLGACLPFPTRTPQQSPS